MKKFRIIGALVTVVATACLLLAITGPASAKTASGVADGFFKQCDATLTISDELIGSPGKIEAWGGYSCPQSFKFVGLMKLRLKNGNAVVKDDAKNVNASTDYVTATMTNSPGVQDWHAELWIFRPGFDPWIISTGMVRS